MGLGLAAEPAHPLQPRLGRSRRAGRGRSASATCGGTSERGALDRRRRAGLQGSTCRPTTSRRPDARGRGRAARRRPVRHAGRRARAGCSRRSGLVDGPLPTHYEPHESPFDNPLYAQQANPVGSATAAADNPLQPVGPEPGADVVPVRGDDLPADRAPHRRRDVAHAARTWPSCSRRCSARSARSSPRERGLEHGGWATIVTRAHGDRGARAGDRADRARCGSGGRTVHQVGLPYHWGSRGLCTRRLGQRPASRSRSTRTCTSRRSRPRPATSGPGRRPRGPSCCAAGRGLPQRRAGARELRRRRRRGRARRLLHRHVDLHRLQGVRGRLQGVERRARRRARASPASPTTTPATLGANRWRHVAFVEQRVAGRRRGRRSRPGQGGGAPAARRDEPASTRRAATDGRCAG